MTAPGLRAVPDGFHLDPDALAAHGAAVDRLAERVQRATAAVPAVDASAYGLVGQLFAGTAASAAADGIAGLDAMARATAATAAALDATRAGYLAAEQAAVTGLSGIRR